MARQAGRREQVLQAGWQDQDTLQECSGNAGQDAESESRHQRTHIVWSRREGFDQVDAGEEVEVEGLEQVEGLTVGLMVQAGAAGWVAAPGLPAGLLG